MSSLLSKTVIPTNDIITSSSSVLLQCKYLFIRMFPVQTLYIKQINYLTGARCWWRSWLRHCAASLKVASSIPDGVIASFSLT